VCAAFIKESSMEFVNANKVYWKSGGSPTTAFLNAESLGKLLGKHLLSHDAEGGLKHGHARVGLAASDGEAVNPGDDNSIS
jgi:hypothetical protein